MPTKNAEDNKRYCREWYRRNKATQLPRIKARTQARLRRLRLLAREAKKGGCIDCGETDPIVLDFDHRDRSTKVESVSQMITWGRGIEKIKEEIAKCDIRCANCHRRKTHKERHYSRITKPVPIRV